MNRFPPVDRRSRRLRCKGSSGASIFYTVLKKAFLVPIAIFATPLGSSASSQPQPPPMSLADIRRFLGNIENQIQKSNVWKIASGKYVNLYYLSGSPPIIRSDVALMDVAVTRDCQFLRFDLPSTKVPVYLFPDNATLSSALGVKARLGSGVSLGDWAVIVAKSSIAPTVLGPSAAHEIGHALIHQYLGSFGSAFFAEGIAFYLEARFQAAPWLSYPSPLEKTSVESLADVANTPNDFAQAARFFGFLMLKDKNDPKRVKAVLAALNTERLHQLMRLGSSSWGARANRVFRNAYGAGLKELGAEWRAEYPPRTGSKRPS